MPKKATKFTQWYAKNRNALNARRRKKYHTDPKYRKRVLTHTRRWRKENPAPPKKQEPKTHFSIGDAANQIGCEQKTIRTLEKAGLIPDTRVNGSSHRRFNQKQIELIRKLVEYRKDVHYLNPKYKPTLGKLSEKAHASWA